MYLDSITVTPGQLLLDPNNYRFHDLKSYKPVINRLKYGDSVVQAKALSYLEDEEFELEALKDSILTNGYVPLEQIVVEAFDQDQSGQRYLVIEGNRRVAAVKSLLKEYENATLDIDDKTLSTLKELPAYELKGTPEEREAFKPTIMAIRHVSGIRPWGSYQQAKLIAELYDQEEHSFARVAQRVGIKSGEVARRYRAIKALQQMEEDEEFGVYASPRLYAFFHEAVSQPKVREWLEWSDQTFTAQNVEARQAFYSLFVPRKIDGDSLPAKIERDVRQVRRLKDIVDKPLPLKVLLDPEKSFEEAIDAAKSEEVDEEPGLLEHSLAQAVQALSKPSIEAWFTPTERARELWNRLANAVDMIRSFMDRKE